MNYDGTINLAYGASAKTKAWKNKPTLWSEFAERLCTAQPTNETYNEFMAFSKEDQSRVKDVGGYVGGRLRGGRRKPENVVNRQVITLDIDFAHLDFWEDFTMQFDNAAVLHGTHKHSALTPKYRLVMPLDRECTPDEYVAVSRQVAGLMGIDLFDKTTFQPCRLMFWPSSPKDVEYYAEQQDGPWLNVDEILESYADWTDTSLWPTAEAEFHAIREACLKLEDPTLKKGVIGAFCRSYTITEVMEKFLSDVYAPTTEDRYTYLKGSAASGVINYEDKHAYSHHGTDPIGGLSCNVFDLVRIHLYRHLDQDATARTGQKSKSFRAMEDFCKNDDKVRGLLAEETISSARYDFDDDFVDEEEMEPEEKAAKKKEATEWLKELEIDPKGKYLATASNLNLIFANDPRLKGVFKQNDFDGKRYICANLPWRKVTGQEPVKNVDYSGVRNYIESIYGIAGNLKIDDALALEFEKQSFHPVKDFLNAQEWDNKPRVDSLLIDYFGADDNIYTREAMRKMLCGAVARIFNPGEKFDLVLTMVSPEQGTGKSTFLKKLGKAWFSDTFLGVNGKEALEQIQGSWIIEMAELAGLRKAEVEAIKHFISKQVDEFRPAYARTSEIYPRQCIFIGTTNNKDFLSDPSGNRRFMPVDVNNTRHYKNVFLDDFDAEVDQIWAEAVALYKAGEKLYLSPAAEAIASKEQRNHSQADERMGMVCDYLERPLPRDWADLDLYDRRTWLDENKETDGTEEREYTCVAEVWCECLGKPKEDMSRYNTRELNEIMRGLEDWEAGKSPRNFKLYGKQKFYSRTL